MASATGALYEPLIERDLDAIDIAANAFANDHSDDELWVAVTRFAVLAYAPSQHAKRAVTACRAAHDVREELGARWRDMIIACARYAAESRPPWSEPPILEPPAIDTTKPHDLEALRNAIATKDRANGEEWLAARLQDAYDDLREVATGDALLMLDTARALEPQLGNKGRYALLRMVLLELLSETPSTDEPLETLVARAIDERGTIDAVRNVFIAIARNPSAVGAIVTGAPKLDPYPLARDYAQTLIAHALASRLPLRQADFLAAVHDNLEHGESYAEWSFA
jgi:hypothetical protein